MLRQGVQIITKKEKRMSQKSQPVNHSPSLSRRHFIASAGVLTAAAWLSPRRLFAEGENIVLAARKRAETAAIIVQPLRGDVKALIGSGGNIAVLTGPDGKFIVDSGYATSRTKITDALARVSPDPIKHLVNTHWHFDHCDGNEWMHSDGATILAHENTGKHLCRLARGQEHAVRQDAGGRQHLRLSQLGPGLEAHWRQRHAAGA